MTKRTTMCLTALDLVVLTSLALHAQSGIPNVSFDHAQVFDRRCAQLLHDTIPAAAFEELDELMVSLHARWAREGPKLLSGVVQITGRKFEFPESRFAATLCTFGSVSFPPIIDMRPFIKSTAKGDVESEAVFETVIMHEVLHHYVDDRLDPWPGGISPLLTKYKDESATVRNHLHLFAIEKLLYSRLNMDSYLAESIVSENKLGPAPAFQRARAIVDRETPRAFVKELTRPPRPPVPRRPPPVPGP